MAKVKITGHASGSGVITVTAPNTSTDRTITLPDATGTLLNSDGSGASLTNLPSATADGFFASSGLSAKDLGVGLHIKIADSGASSVAADCDELVIENSGESGITLLAGTSAASRIAFGDSGNNKIGMVYYNHGSNYMQFTTNDTEQMRITSDGRGLSSFTAKGWVRFNGSTINDSHNVSSVSISATGQYRVYWDVDFANANYAVAGMGHADRLLSFDGAANAAYINLNSYATSGSREGGNYESIIAFGS